MEQDSIHIPCSWSTTLAFDWEERSFIHQVYEMLYSQSEVPTVQDTPITFQKHRSVTIDDEFYSSLACKRNTKCNIVLSSWASKEGQLNLDSFSPRPGGVLFYISHSITVADQVKQHVLACFKWFVSTTGTPREDLHPISLWEPDLFEEGGPASFMPVQRI